MYRTNDGAVKVGMVIENDTVWTTQKNMAKIFGVTIPTINEHVQNIFKSSELQADSVIRNFRITATDGKEYDTMFYNLDVIISVGYRVNSYQATQFRIWSTKILKEYLIKGFVLDDDRLKQAKQVFGKDYFDELVERIREIRASERRFYQKITDLYSQCSIDYDPDSPVTQTFFATAQNKLEYAIAHQTAAEIIKSRASHLQPHMGLTTWDNSPNGKVLKRDVSVAKNYLNKEEISELNSVVSSYLDFAERLAKRQRALTMQEWVEKLDDFLTLNEYEILRDAGSIKAKLAKEYAESEYEKFRVIQDRNFVSDFDRVVKKIGEENKLPSNEQQGT